MSGKNNVRDFRRLAVSLCLAGGFVGGALADAKIWSGAVNGTWDFSTLNWLDPAGVACKLGGSDSVLFTDAGAQKTVTLAASPTTIGGSITFDNTQAYTLNGGLTGNGTTSTTAGLCGTGTFTKRGSGKLTISNNHSFKGDIVIEGGELVAGSGQSCDGNGIHATPLGDPRANRKIKVMEGAKLTINANCVSGAGATVQETLYDVEVHGGTFQAKAGTMHTLRNFWLDNATLNFTTGINDTWVSWGWWGTIKFTGSTPYTINSSDASKGTGATSAIAMGHWGPTVLEVADITGNANSDVILNIPIKRIDRAGTAGSSGAFTKTGAGTLELRSNYNSITGDIEVAQGVLVLNGGSSNGDAPSATTVVGTTAQRRTITVDNGATLRYAKSDVMGQAYTESKVVTALRPGSTLALADNTANGLGNIEFDGATFTYRGRPQTTYRFKAEDPLTTNYWPTFVTSGITVKGTKALTLVSLGSSTCIFGKQSGDGMAEINLARTNPAADFEIDLSLEMGLIDGIPRYTFGDNRVITGIYKEGLRSSFRKTGPGTLHIGRTGAAQSDYTGNVEIREGKVRIYKDNNTTRNREHAMGTTALGNLWSDHKRTISVLSGAELEFKDGDMLGQLACQFTDTTIAVTNGTVRFPDNTANALPHLDLYDANLVYSGIASGANASFWSYGTFGWNGGVTFGGTKPYTMPIVGGKTKIGLGFKDERRDEGANIWGKCTLEVADITKNALADVTLDPYIADLPTWPSASYYRGKTFKCGLIKTGAGTLRLTYTGNDYSNDTDVREGALVVDGSLTQSKVNVASGAFLGGKGSVTAVTFADGAGLTALPGQTKGLSLTSVTLPPSRRMTINLGYGETIKEGSRLRVPVVADASLFEGVAFDVTVDGAALPKGFVASVRNVNGTLVAGFGREGLAFIVR